MDRHVANTEFVDGVKRPVFESPDGRQYVVDDDGELARVRCLVYFSRHLTRRVGHALRRPAQHRRFRLLILCRECAVGTGEDVAHQPARTDAPANVVGMSVRGETAPQ